MFGEGVVAAVVRRHCHDSACAVTREHVIGNINRYLALGQRIDGITSREHTRHFSIRNSLALRAVLAARQISVHFFALLVGHHPLHILALRRKNHKRHAKHRIRTSREDGERRILPLHGELHLCSFRTAYPVTLRLFQTLRPIDSIQPFQQTAGISAHAQTPLPHDALLYRITAANTQTLAHLIIRQHGSEFRTPVDFRVRQISDAVVHQLLLLLFLA